MKSRFGTRRDMCYFVGKRAAMLTRREAVAAWKVLAQELEAMGEMDVPKFRDLVAAIRKGTIAGRREKR